MEIVTLPHTGLTVSRLCFGTMTFGGQVQDAEAAAIVNECLNRGINFFDTANVYTRGASEEMLGRVLGSRRKDVILATKVRGKTGDGPDEEGLSRQAIRKAIEASLRRLGTDYVDIYYFHQPDYRTPIEESLEEMSRLVEEGKVRYPATSNYAAWQVADILGICERSGFPAPWISQPMYNLLARGIEQEYLPMAQHFDVSTAVYNPLAGGLLTGKQSREQPASGTRFDNNQMYLDRYWHPQYFDAVEELSLIASSSGRSIVSLALNWLLHHTSATCLILGASSLDQLRSNLDACEEGPLEEETVTDCDGVWSRLRGITPRYNR